jgi:signal transduction histidine kinase
LEVQVDKLRLSIILTNVISNAIKYSDRNKPNPQVEVDFKVKDDQVYITVTDNGIGIRKEQLTKVFDMFYRASERSSGAGLGLYITMEAVKTLGGDIRVDSKNGEGTTFEIVIPNSEL